jgi:hypothetical protein
VGFAQRQPCNQIVVGRHLTNCADSEESEPDFRSYDNLSKLSGYEYFEDILDWILDIDDFFEYVRMPSEIRWKYLLVKLTGRTLRW